VNFIVVGKAFAVTGNAR